MLKPFGLAALLAGCLLAGAGHAADLDEDWGRPGYGPPPHAYGPPPGQGYGPPPVPGYGPTPPYGPPPRRRAYYEPGPYPGYGEPRCYVRPSRYVNEDGEVIVRPRRVCE